MERTETWQAVVALVVLAAGLAVARTNHDAIGRAHSVDWSGPQTPEASYDLVIAGGKIVDGTGNAWFYGDVGIRGDRISRVTPVGFLANAPTRERVDAHGMVVAPGFIDIQAQSIAEFLTGDSRVISKITQGITTEILGEGWTPAPSNEHTTEGAGFLPPVAAEATRAFQQPHGFEKWIEAMQQHGTSPNFGSFLGAETVRKYVKGMAQGVPNAAELDQMRALVSSSMEDGAFGIASALIYPPGNYATTGELIEMAHAMAPYGGLYISHMRSEGGRLLEAIDEALRIGREGGVPVEIYHLKAAGVSNWPKMRETIAKINAARAAGQDVAADMYPYVAGGTTLAACLPPWTSADGKLIDNLRDPATRAKIRAELLHPATYFESPCALSTPEGSLIVGVQKPENKKWIGKRLSQIAAAQHKDWMDAMMDLITTEEGVIDTVFFFASEDNLKLQMRQPWLKFGTDANGVDPDTEKNMVHPRAYGT